MSAKKSAWMDFTSWFGRPMSPEKYGRLVFPHGEAQRTAVEALLAQLLPQETPQMRMMTFVSGKEAYFGSFADPDEEMGEEARRAAVHKEVCRILLKNEQELAPAIEQLIYADIAVGDDLAYPAPEELRARAAAQQG